MVAHLWLGMAVALQSGTPMVTIVAATGTYLHLQHPGAQGQGMRVGQAVAAGNQVNPPDTRAFMWDNAVVH